MYKLYTDAATTVNENKLHYHSAGGVLILHQQQQIQIQIPIINAVDNHTAEFKTCIVGFHKLIETITNKKLSQTIVSYYTDSKILADSLNKQYAKHYQPFVDIILALEAHFQLVINQWIPESQNMGAHTLAQQALHQLK